MEIIRLSLPESVPVNFESLWDMHPQERHIVKIRGKEFRVPRYQQAYGKSYAYSGSVNVALPIQSELQVFLDYAQKEIHPALNGVLVNWYDAAENHYIGPHSDSIIGLQEGSPIITISLGASRVFKVTGEINELIETQDRMVLVMPWEVNISCKHQVLKPDHRTGNRISITLRAFND